MSATTNVVSGYDMTNGINGVGGRVRAPEHRAARIRQAREEPGYGYRQDVGGGLGLPARAVLRGLQTRGEGRDARRPPLRRGRPYHAGRGQGVERSSTEAVTQAALYTFSVFGKARDAMSLTMDTGRSGCDIIPDERIESAYRVAMVRMGDGFAASLADSPALLEQVGAGCS